MASQSHLIEIHKDAIINNSWVKIFNSKNYLMIINHSRKYYNTKHKSHKTIMIERSWLHNTTKAEFWTDKMIRTAALSLSLSGSMSPLTINRQTPTVHLLHVWYGHTQCQWYSYLCIALVTSSALTVCPGDG